MITEKELKLANQLIEKRKRIKSILHDFDGPHVETTVGLVEVNSAAKYETQSNRDADWIHQNMPELEQRLKAHCRSMLESALHETNIELATLIG